jgi:hypothetical protein
MASTDHQSNGSLFPHALSSSLFSSSRHRCAVRCSSSLSRYIEYNGRTNFGMCGLSQSIDLLVGRNTAYRSSHRRDRTTIILRQAHHSRVERQRWGRQNHRLRNARTCVGAQSSAAHRSARHRYLRTERTASTRCGERTSEEGISRLRYLLTCILGSSERVRLVAGVCHRESLGHVRRLPAHVARTGGDLERAS